MSKDYTFSTDRNAKRRKLSNGIAVPGSSLPQEESYARKLPRSSQQQRPAVSIPAAEVNLPVQILYAGSPQDLAYAILTSDKVYFTKQDLLTIVNKLDCMLCPKFVGSCTYIN